MEKLPKTTDDQEKKDKAFLNLWAYIEGKARKIGYAYTTQNGSLCIRGDKLMDKSQLGQLLIKGLYVHPPEE